jgi:hypothetical protein
MATVERLRTFEMKMLATLNSTHGESEPSIRDIISAAVDIEKAAAEAAEYILEVEGEFLQETYLYNRGIEDGGVDFTDKDVALDFKDFVAERAFEQVYQAMDALRRDIDLEGDAVRLWRSIVVPPDWLCQGIHERPLGVCWAYQKSAAEAHWGEFGEGRSELVLEALVHVDDVDWQQSVCLNAHTECEREIRIKPTAFVHLISAEWASRYEAKPRSVIELDEVLAAGEEAFGSKHSGSPEFGSPLQPGLMLPSL